MNGNGTQDRRGGRRLGLDSLALLALGFALGWLAHANRELDARLTGGDGPASLARSADPARSTNALFSIELLTEASGTPGRSTVCLGDGLHGQVVQDGKVYNRNSHVDFDRYKAGHFKAGIQGADEGLIHDLGPLPDLQARCGGDPLELLRWRDGELGVGTHEVEVPDAIPGSATTTPTGSWFESLFSSSWSAPTASEYASVRLDHVYFVRIRNTSDHTETVALLHVEAFDIGQRVQLRGARL